MADLAARQHGAWSVAQAVDLGVGRRTILRQVDRGEVIELLPGILRSPSTPISWRMRAMGALLWAGGDAVLARTSAATVLGLDLPRSLLVGGAPIELLVHQRTFVPVDGVVVHRTTRPPPASRIHEDGPLRATDGTRTSCDLAADLGPSALRRVVSSAVRLGLTEATALRSEMRLLGRFRGKRAVRVLVDELSPLLAQCNSALETLFVQRMRPRGLEPTAMNHRITDGRGRTRYLDAAYLPEMLPVELDSKRWHGSVLDRNEDLQREDDVLLTGDWQPFLRFTWADVHDRPDDVACQIRDALRVARAQTSIG